LGEEYVVISPKIPKTKASNHKLNAKGFEISGTSLRFIVRYIVQCSSGKKSDHFTALIVF